jgi:hypothetical protein
MMTDQELTEMVVRVMRHQLEEKMRRDGAAGGASAEEKTRRG